MNNIIPAILIVTGIFSIAVAVATGLFIVATTNIPIGTSILLMLGMVFLAGFLWTVIKD